MTATLGVGTWLPPGFDAAGDLLGFARQRRADANRAEVDILIAATDWAELHPSPWFEDAAVHEFGDQAIPVAGEGVPLVAEFAVTEFAAALGLSTDAGKRLVGEAMELRHRLLRLWEAVKAGQCLPWRARRIAAATITLTPEGAEFVDRQLSGIANTVGIAQLDRLITEATARYTPEETLAEVEARQDHRYFAIEHDHLGFSGTARIDGLLDLTDALDLEAAIRAGAAQLARLGHDGSLDVRRSIAVGELARRQLALGFGHDDTDQSVGEGRAVTLHVHVSADAIAGEVAEPASPWEPASLRLARVEETRTVVTAQQVAEWCGGAAKVIVKPVIDLADHVHVDAYEIPDRIAERTDLRDLHCVFPWCHRPAKRCDHDHIRAHAGGGVTCPCNMGPLCRRHHRLKTHDPGWTYTMVEAGTFVWSSPQGYTFLRDHTGTRDVTPDPGRHSGANRSSVSPHPPSRR